jgi:hypothetical protein
MFRRAAILALFVGACAAPQVAPGMAAPQAPVHLQGSGIMNTAPFRLGGGDYTVAWTATDTGSITVGCYHGASLHQTSGRGGSELLVNELLDGGQTKGGTTHVYNVAAGSYYIDASSGCAWEFDITR